VTEWEQFRALDLKLLHRLMAKPIVVDLRKIYRTEEMERHGFIYLSVGNAVEQPQPPALPRMRMPAT
jgi:UDPglucose 6-dehydrogenase